MDLTYYKKYEPIDGKWYICRIIGKGAFGVVLEVERRDIDVEHSALKVISVPASHEELEGFRRENYRLSEQQVGDYYRYFVDEFENEFKLMSKLRGNSHIVSIEDCDVTEKQGEIGWDIFIRMELLTTVTDYFKEHQPTQEDVIRLGIDICKALESCQKYKIVHRDIKPSNIFVTPTGDYKLGDFGVARVLEKTTVGMSQKGTPVYMAPELYKGEADNANVDLYSLGIVMYMFLNDGFEPFRTGVMATDREQAFLRRLQGREPIPAPAYADDKLARIVLKACSYRPEDRYQHPSQLRRELESLLKSSHAPVSGEIPAVGGNMPESETSGTLDKAKEMFPFTFDSDADTPPEIKPDTPASGEIPAVGGDLPENETAGTLDKAKEMFPFTFDSDADTPPEIKPDTPASGKIPAVDGVPDSGIARMVEAALAMFMPAFDSEPDTQTEEKAVIPPEPPKKQSTPGPTKETPEQPEKKPASPADDDYTPVEKDGKWGFADKNGKVVIPCVYEEVGDDDSFRYGGDVACVKKNGIWGAVNRNNEEVIPFIYDDLWAFYDEDITQAEIGGKCGAIDKNGHVVIPFMYQDMWIKSGWISAKKDYRWGTVDRNNKKLIPFMYDNFLDFEDNFACARKNRRYGVINKKNEVIVPFMYECIIIGKNGLFGAELNGKWGVIDSKGNTVVDFMYDCNYIVPSSDRFRVVNNDHSSYDVKYSDVPKPEQKPDNSEAPKDQNKPQPKSADATNLQNVPEPKKVTPDPPKAEPVKKEPEPKKAEAKLVPAAKKRFFDQKILNYSEENIRYYRRFHILILLFSIPTIVTSVYHNHVFPQTFDYVLGLIIDGLPFLYLLIQSVVSLAFVVRYTYALQIKHRYGSKSDYWFRSEGAVADFLAQYNNRDAKFFSTHVQNVDPAKKYPTGHGVAGYFLMAFSAVFGVIMVCAEISVRINIKMNYTFVQQTAQNLDLVNMVVTFVILFVIGLLHLRRGKKLDREMLDFYRLKLQSEEEIKKQK